MSENTTRQIHIKKIPVIPFQVSVHCDCGGTYEFTDSPVALHPRVFKHTCNKCGSEIILLESYPKIVYEEIINEPESN